MSQRGCESGKQSITYQQAITLPMPSLGLGRPRNLGKHLLTSHADAIRVSTFSRRLQFLMEKPNLPVVFKLRAVSPLSGTRQMPSGTQEYTLPVICHEDIWMCIIPSYPSGDLGNPNPIIPVRADWRTPPNLYSLLRASPRAGARADISRDGESFRTSSYQ